VKKKQAKLNAALQSLLPAKTLESGRNLEPVISADGERFAVSTVYSGILVSKLSDYVDVQAMATPSRVPDAPTAGRVIWSALISRILGRLQQSA
jgi:hypothetical protein